MHSKKLTIIFFLLSLAGFFPICVEAKLDANRSFLDNGIIRIGVDLSRGACVAHFGDSKSKRNLLNHYDAGRYLQQSYYGDRDGTNWNGKPWRYNPIQGGNWKGKAARLDHFETSTDSTTIQSTTTPHHWAGESLCKEMVMQQEIRLDGHLAVIDFSMKYDGPDQQALRHQEMPAVFLDGKLNRFFHWTNGKYKEASPRILGENGKKGEKGLGIGRSGKAWFAYLDENGSGLGIHTPGTPDFTCYRALGNGKTGPSGSACSYMAPIRTFKLKKGMKLDYRVYLTAGTLKEIAARFAKLEQGH